MLVLSVVVILTLMSCGGDGNIVSEQNTNTLCQRVFECFPQMSLLFSSGELCSSIRGIMEGNVGTEQYPLLNKSTLGCLSKAKNCSEMNICIKGTEELASHCKEKGHICVGDTYVECKGQGMIDIMQDCKQIGLKCIQVDDHARCSIGECDKAKVYPYCDGDNLIDCDKGIIETKSCPFSLGISCKQSNGEAICKLYGGGKCLGDQGEAECKGTEGDCGGDFQPHCEGDRFVSCRKGKIALLDCPSLYSGFTCIYNEKNKNMPCGFKTDQCEITKDNCIDNDTLAYCFFGKIETIDCLSLGYSKCIKSESPKKTVGLCIK